MPPRECVPPVDVLRQHRRVLLARWSRQLDRKPGGDVPRVEEGLAQNLLESMLALLEDSSAEPIPQCHRWGDFDFLSRLNESIALSCHWPMWN